MVLFDLLTFALLEPYSIGDLFLRKNMIHNIVSDRSRSLAAPWLWCPQVLADTLPTCQQLANLILNDNPLGAAGAEALVAALPQCSVLQGLRLQRCDLDEQTKKTLRQAWAQNGKLAKRLFL